MKDSKYQTDAGSGGICLNFRLKQCLHVQMYVIKGIGTFTLNNMIINVFWVGKHMDCFQNRSVPLQ